MRILARLPDLVPYLDPIRIGPDLDRIARGAGLDRIAVVIELREAGRARTPGGRTVAPEWTRVENKARALRLENLADRLDPELRMIPFRKLKAPILEPIVRIGKRLELRTRREQAPANEANLVLHLPLPVARSRSAGRRLHKMVAAQLKEPRTPCLVLARANPSTAVGMLS